MNHLDNGPLKMQLLSRTPLEISPHSLENLIEASLLSTETTTMNYG